MRYLLLLLTVFSLSSCAETGHLLGAITVFPIKVLTGSAGYNEMDNNATNGILNTNEATLLHMSE